MDPSDATPIPDYPVDKAIPLPARGTWPPSVHRFDAATAAALRAAEAAGRPLLLRGEPGTGKSQTARAAAEASGRLFLSVTIDGRIEAHDLLWYYDAVARLADAHTSGAGPAEHYLSPGPLWWAYDWPSAMTQWNHRKQGERPTWSDGDQTPPAGTVLLIDEIDKADPDLPNALLELLANRGFSVPYAGARVVRGNRAPLVIITTNEERELPNAFLRRCLVHTLRLPEPLRPWLVALGRLHMEALGLKDRCFTNRLEEAAGQLLADRRDALRDQRYAPGLAEYLDLVIALARLGETDREQKSLLKDIQGFVFDKSLREGGD